MTEHVRVRGLDNLQRTMGNLADDLDDLADTSAAAADILVGSAQGYAPRRTGRLRGSIEAKSTRTGATVTAGVGIVSPYPAVHEYGSRRRHITGSHYMRKAAESKERAVVNEYEKSVDKSVRQVKGA